jgi:hypothetical protein
MALWLYRPVGRRAYPTLGDLWGMPLTRAFTRTCDTHACVKAPAIAADRTDMSSSPRLSVVAPAAGLCVLALGAGFFFMSRGQESSQAATGLSTQQLVQRAAAKRNTVSTNKAAPKITAPKRSVAPKPKPKPKRIDRTLNAGLPSTISAAFWGRKVVVVALYAPDVPLDEMAVAEARAGASAAGVGFVALNVLHESQARPLTKLLGVLEDPGVLVFRRPGDLFLRLSGYADQQTVAQAARNAAL